LPIINKFIRSRDKPITGADRMKALAQHRCLLSTSSLDHATNQLQGLTGMKALAQHRTQNWQSKATKPKCFRKGNEKVIAERQRVY